jgi:hypothetical protein
MRTRQADDNHDTVDAVQRQGAFETDLANLMNVHRRMVALETCPELEPAASTIALSLA